MDIRLRVNTRGIDQLYSGCESMVDQVLGKVANDVVADMDKRWSVASPSSPGAPPAVVTGNLKNNTEARRAAPRLWHVRVKTKYALPLEFGTRRMPPRPFLRPALDRASRRLPREIRIGVEGLAR